MDRVSGEVYVSYRLQFYVYLDYDLLYFFLYLSLDVLYQHLHLFLLFYKIFCFFFNFPTGGIMLAVAITASLTSPALTD